MAPPEFVNTAPQPSTPAPDADPDAVIIGGCGRVGLPLGLALSARGLSIALLDSDQRAVAEVNRGQMPFVEPGAQHHLTQALHEAGLRATTDPSIVAVTPVVIVVVATPVDAHQYPELSVIPNLVRQYGPHLRDGQLIVLRSTLFPGTTRHAERLLDERGIHADVVCCPERIAEGHAMSELFDLPQLIGARTPTALARAEKLFQHLSRTIALSPEEAEFAKLAANTWRYMKFAAANQLWMIANDAGLDFERIRLALTDQYPRAEDLPRPGFTAGPCLPKDTQQLLALANNNAPLAHAALAVNEALPLYLIARLAQLYRLEDLTVGILGTAFKADNDDDRESLVSKLRAALTPRARRVLCADPYVHDPQLITQEQILTASDLIIIGTPHERYRTIRTMTSTPVIDIFNVTGQGVQV